MRTLVLASAISLVCACGCKKYQDGPLVDFQTLTSRAANKWIVSQAFENTADTITGQVHFEIDLDKNNNAIYADTSLVDSIPQLRITTELGSWAFTNNNSDIAIVLNHNQDLKLWQILRLTDDQFWVLEKVGNNYFQYNLVPKP